MTVHARPDERRTASTRRYPEPIRRPRARTAEIDYWEEVALARLRLAQLALAVTLVGSVAIALILG